MTTSHTFTLDAFRHMRAFGPSSYRPSIETPEQGAVRAALELARAEYALRASSVEVSWQRDPYPDLSWCDAEQLRELRAGETEMLECTLYGPDGEPIESMGGIHVLAGDESYKRVVEAELALQAGVCHPLDRDING